MNDNFRVVVQGSKEQKPLIAAVMMNYADAHRLSSIDQSNNVEEKHKKKSMT